MRYLSPCLYKFVDFYEKIIDEQIVLPHNSLTVLPHLLMLHMLTDDRRTPS